MLWKVFDDSVASTESLASSGWPDWSLLAQNRLYSDRDLIEAILSRLTAHRIHLLTAPEGRGKSTLASLIAFARFRTGHRVNVVICPAPGVEPDHLTASMLDWDRTAPLWIFEDSHASTHPLNLLKDELAQCKKTQLLIVARTVSPDLLDLPDGWPFKELKKPGSFTFLRPNAQVLRGVVESNLRPPSLTSPSRPSSTGLITDQDIDWALETTGGDLRTLKSFLEAWEPAKCSLRELRIESVYDRLIETKLRPLATEPQVLDTYGYVCAIFQFDVPVLGDISRLNALTALTERGLMSLRGQNTYVLPHTSDARLAVAAYCQMMKKNRDTFTSNCIQQYFTQELPQWYAMRCLTGMATNAAVVQFEAPRALLEELGRTVLDRATPQVVARYIRSFCKDRRDLDNLLRHMTWLGFRALLSRGDMNDWSALLAAIRKIDDERAQRLDDHISINERISLNARASLGFLARRLHHYQRNAKSLYFARQILAETVKTDFQERIRLATAGSAGRFLNVAFEIDPDLAGKAASDIAEHVDFVREMSAEELGLLLANIRFADVAWLRLVSRLIVQGDPAGLLKSSPKGYSYVLSGIAESVSKGVAPALECVRFFRAFTEGVDDQMLPEIGCKQVNWIIRDFLLVGGDASPWLRARMCDLVRLFSEAELYLTFWLCWNLLQADEGLCREFVDQASPNLSPRVTAGAGMDNVALVGLLQTIGVEWRVGEQVDSDGLVSELSEAKGPDRVLFALRYLQATQPDVYDSILLQLRSKWGNIRSHIEEMISQNPLSHSRQLLLSVLNALPAM